MSLAVPSPGKPALEWLKKSWALWALILGSILVVIGALVLVGAPPGHTMWDLIQSSLGSARSITGMLREVTPLLISGIAVFLALRSGLFNIGVEGQFTVGALTCAVVAIKVPGMMGALLGMVAGMAAGGLLALPAAAIKAYKGGHEVITTIMLNNAAALLTSALVAGPLKQAGQESPQTAQILESTYLPDALHIGELHINSGLVIGVLVAMGLWWWLKRTVSGYELQAVGANPIAAKFAGVNARSVVMKSMTWSGALGGLAGAIQILGFEHYYFPNLSSGYGFDALGVALLAGGTPIGLLPSSALFGMLNKGGTTIQILDQVPKGITSVILGLLIIIAAAIRYRKTAVGGE